MTTREFIRTKWLEWSHLKIAEGALYQRCVNMSKEVELDFLYSHKSLISDGTGCSELRFSDLHVCFPLDAKKPTARPRIGSIHTPAS